MWAGRNVKGFKVPSKPSCSRIPWFHGAAWERKGSLGSMGRKESLEVGVGTPGCQWNVTGFQAEAFQYSLDLRSRLWEEELPGSMGRSPWKHGQEGIPGSTSGQGTHARARVLRADVRSRRAAAPGNWPGKG